MYLTEKEHAGTECQRAGTLPTGGPHSWSKQVSVQGADRRLPACQRGGGSCQAAPPLSSAALL